MEDFFSFYFSILGCCLCYSIYLISRSASSQPRAKRSRSSSDASTMTDHDSGDDAALVAIGVQPPIMNVMRGQAGANVTFQIVSLGPANARIVPLKIL